MTLRRGFGDDGRVTVPLENVWARVRKWARRNIDINDVDIILQAAVFDEIVYA